MAHRKKIVYITGSRADYGLMRNTLRCVDANEDLDLSLIVTGMHLSKKFGYTIRDIEKDNFKIAAKIPVLGYEDTGANMIKSFGRLIIALPRILEELDPDIMLLLGDRWEMVAGAMVGHYMGKLIVHIHGGELSGGVDEPNRHVISRYSHIHLVPHKESELRLIKMGEEKRRIRIVGSPGLDDIVQGHYSPPTLIKSRYGIEIDHNLILVVQHPIVTEYEKAAEQIKITLEAVSFFGYQTIVMYPNADAGGLKMIKIIREYANKHPFIKAFTHISRDDFLGLMVITAVMVGNSSSGLIEAPSFSLPVVNIGQRQQGRFKPKNVINTNHKATEIIEAIKRALDPEFRKNLIDLENQYGDGKTGQRIVNTLSRLRITSKTLQKKLAY